MSRTLASLVLAALAFVGGACRGSAPATTTPVGLDSHKATAAPGIVATSGTVVPVKVSQLRFDAAGRVQQPQKRVGEQVRAGEVIIALDSTALRVRKQQAESDLELAKVQLTQAEMTVRAATAERDVAQIRLRQVQGGAKPEEVAVAKADLDKATVALQRAQESYDRIKWQPGASALPQSLALQEATIEYERVKAIYDLRTADADALDVEAARLEVTQAQARLEVAETEIAMAQARVRCAELDLEEAKANAAGAMLLAPWDGVVASLSVNEGELVDASAPAVILADVSAFRVETSDLTEMYISQVKIGQEAHVVVNAFRDQRLEGVVSTISPVSLVQHGDTTYTVTIDLSPTSLPLRWGMTAQVEIAVGP